MSYFYFPKYEPQEAPLNFIPDNFLRMARPTTTKTVTTYKKTHGGGLYRITYQAPSGAKRPGIPHDDLNGLVNLVKVGGPLTDNPQFIVTSEADFLSSFTEHNPLRADTQEGTRT